MSGRIPAWSLTPEAAASIEIAADWPERVTKEWALDGATGEGVDVCILDSGVDGEHPLVGGIESAVAVTLDGEDATVVPDELGDVCGHGTACAGIIRSLAPACRLHSVRVLGEGNTGSADLILGGLRHAIEQHYRRRQPQPLDDEEEVRGDAARPRRQRLLRGHGARRVRAQHARGELPLAVLVGDLGREPPGDRTPGSGSRIRIRRSSSSRAGVDLDVAWYGGSTIRATGNSFAAPHIAGLSTLVLSKHPGLTPFQLKSILYLTAANTGGTP